MLIEIIRIAFISLASNRLRSLLATLGIMIGITAVSTLLSVGQSFQNYTRSQFSWIEIDIVMLQAQSDLYYSDGSTGSSQLTDADITAIGKLENVRDIVVWYTSYVNLRSDTNYTSASLVGTTPSYLRPGEKMAMGRFLTQRDMEDRARVAVLTWDIARQLFTDGRPLGREIIVQGVALTVVGVLPPEESQRFYNNLVVPLNLARDRLVPLPSDSLVKIHQASIYLEDTTQASATEERIRTLLRKRHKLADDQPDDFSFASYIRESVESANRVLTGITVFLGIIGGISLLVGGIGITNIMLVSVAERTREIGLRKAVGAKRLVILGQFLVEALLLSLLGGLGGVGFTAVLVHGGAIAVQLLFPDAGIAHHLTLDTSAVTLALVFASVVGVVAGIYPAFRASRLSPIEALRTN